MTVGKGFPEENPLAKKEILPDVENDQERSTCHCGP